MMSTKQELNHTTCRLSSLNKLKYYYAYIVTADGSKDQDFQEKCRSK